MDIVFHETYDKQLMQRAVFLASAPSRRNTLLRWGLALLVVVGSVFVLYEAAAGGREITLPWLARRLFVFAIGLYYLIGPYIRRWRMAAAMWSKEQGSAPVSGRITPLGISYGSDEDGVTYPWADFYRLHTDDKLQLMVLVTAKGVMVGLARRFFESEADWQRAQQLVRLKVVQPAP